MDILDGNLPLRGSNNQNPGDLKNARTRKNKKRRVREVGRTKVNGPAVAAILSAMIGPLVMGIVNVGTTASADFSNWVLSIGKLWVPSLQGIGPYSGKETFLLAG